MRRTSATLALLTALALSTHAQAQAQEPTTVPPDSTTGSTIRWEGRKFETIYQTEKGGRYLARTNKGIYYRKFIKEEEERSQQPEK
jgi:hypothetical protein